MANQVKFDEDLALRVLQLLGNGVEVTQSSFSKFGTQVEQLEGIGANVSKVKETIEDINKNDMPKLVACLERGRSIMQRLIDDAHEIENTNVDLSL